MKLRALAKAWRGCRINLGPTVSFQTSPLIRWHSKSPSRHPLSADLEAGGRLRILGNRLTLPGFRRMASHGHAEDGPIALTGNRTKQTRLRPCCITCDLAPALVRRTSTQNAPICDCTCDRPQSKGMEQSCDARVDFSRIL